MTSRKWSLTFRVLQPSPEMGRRLETVVLCSEREDEAVRRIGLLV